mmetsp:Transcript_4413/g.11270  ORF Transcript_4413/g.11270 Transcript_4413/m.11270 type:complete len:294 (+) Transcript_4413:1122-2003(+)
MPPHELHLVQQPLPSVEQQLLVLQPQPRARAQPAEHCTRLARARVEQRVHEQTLERPREGHRANVQMAAMEPHVRGSAQQRDLKGAETEGRLPRAVVYPWVVRAFEGVHKDFGQRTRRARRRDTRVLAKVEETLERHPLVPVRVGLRPIRVLLRQRRANEPLRLHRRRAIGARARVEREAWPEAIAKPDGMQRRDQALDEPHACSHAAVDGLGRRGPVADPWQHVTLEQRSESLTGADRHRVELYRQRRECPCEATIVHPPLVARGRVVQHLARRCVKPARHLQVAQQLPKAL